MRLAFRKEERSRTKPRSHAGFTLPEVLVASAISSLVLAGTMTFLWFSGLAMSGATTQALLNQEAGNALEFIQSRARLALCVSNDTSGNTLTLGFDDNPTIDLNSDGRFANDTNHFERFQFIGINGSATNSSTNHLVYIPDISKTNQRTLIPSGVRNLPGDNIFRVTNGFITIVRFGIVDGYNLDHYQSVDVQGTVVPYNRPVTTNIIGIIP
jgi:prepilin-type N-terminal cleavage/methylation domain-containing protein